MSGTGVYVPAEGWWRTDVGRVRHAVETLPVALCGARVKWGSHTESFPACRRCVALGSARPTPASSEESS